MTTAEAVLEHLEADLVLHEALSRGVLNYRRTARWIIDRYGWDATEEAIVSALRRYEAPRRVEFHEARERLADAEVEAETRLTVLTTSRLLGVLERIPEALSLAEPEDTVALLPGLRELQLVVERHLADDVLDVLRSENARAEAACALHLRFTEDDAATQVAIALTLHALGYQEKTVLGLYSSEQECTILVPPEELPSTFRLATRL